MVASQLTQYLSVNGLAEPHQSAYRSGHSTETALLRVRNDIIHSVGQKEIVLLILLDLSAAFDTVNHDTLANILQSSGISGTVLNWLTSYLSNRHQIIKINSSSSEPRALTCGVPQGSVLGPVLFTIYTSSLGRLLRSNNINYHLYADDTQIWVTCKQSDLPDAVNRLQNCIALIQSWMAHHQLKLNEDKTEFLVISSLAARTTLIHIIQLATTRYFLSLLSETSE